MFSRDAHWCESCGELFWGAERAKYCSQPCRLRSWRARRRSRMQQPLHVELCQEVVRRHQGSAEGAASKLLPRLFRAVAAELRRRGWDPIELLMSTPDEPASETDRAAVVMSGQPPALRKWLYPPEVELEKLEVLISDRLLHGEDVSWHLERREQIAEYLIVRDADASAAKAT